MLEVSDKIYILAYFRKHINLTVTKIINHSIQFAFFTTSLGIDSYIFYITQWSANLYCKQSKPSGSLFEIFTSFRCEDFGRNGVQEGAASFSSNFTCVFLDYKKLSRKSILQRAA